MHTSDIILENALQKYYDLKKEKRKKTNQIYLDEYSH